MKVLWECGVKAHLLTLAEDDHFSMVNRLSEEGYFLTKVQCAPCPYSVGVLLTFTSCHILLLLILAPADSNSFYQDSHGVAIGTSQIITVIMRW